MSFLSFFFLLDQSSGEILPEAGVPQNTSFALRLAPTFIDQERHSTTPPKMEN
jgi:hypothetical protein